VRLVAAARPANLPRHYCQRARVGLRDLHAAVIEQHPQARTLERRLVSSSWHPGLEDRRWLALQRPMARGERREQCRWGPDLEGKTAVRTRIRQTTRRHCPR
jgi:hypothetical protein